MLCRTRQQLVGSEREALTLCSVPPVQATCNSPLPARVAGFSLHAASACEAQQRGRLERLCRYFTRPPRLPGCGSLTQPFADGFCHDVGNIRVIT